jgi:ADP-ribosyl-[dinitrogen reductase] hydrolase
MLLELAIGDAYGAGFEYADTKLISAHNDLSRYVQHPRHHGIFPGAYTDDTQMSLAIAEAIVSGEDWTAENLAKRFVEVFKRDPREGYASRFYDFLVGVKDGTQFLAEIRPDSDKSGAAMRAAPIGVYGSIDEVLEKAEIQAAITHNTTDGINAAKAAALMSHYFIYKLGAKSELGRFIESHVAGEWATVWKGKVGAKGWMSVRAAITAVSRNARMSDLLKDCINFSGDVDTVATIALAAASCSEEVEQDLPPVLIEKLENGKFGRDYLTKLNQSLMRQVKG